MQLRHVELPLVRLRRGLEDRRVGDPYPAGQRGFVLLQSIQVGVGTLAASFSAYCILIPQQESGWNVLLTLRVHLGPRLRMRAATSCIHMLEWMIFNQTQGKIYNLHFK